MGCWTWLSCMNAVPLSCLAQNQQVYGIASSFGSWMVSLDQFQIRRDTTHSISTRVGKSIQWWIFSMVGNFYVGYLKETYLQTAVLSCFEWVVHINRFSFWYESFIKYFLKTLFFGFLLGSFLKSIESYRYLEVTLEEHTHVQFLPHALM